jgi:riboflavin synthase
MFTGLIKDVGQVVAVEENLEGKVFEIKTNLIHDISIDDSVAVNGCCLTATKVSESTFTVQAVHVTMEKTSLGNLVKGSEVNLELAMKLNDRLGGHLVQGHVNDKAILKSYTRIGENYNLWFEIPFGQMKYIIKEGSIALAGISLTVADIKENLIMVTIIPHTWQNTILKSLSIESVVNLEVDMMAKYLENFSKYESRVI